MKRIGKVSLVGAGPGDPDLLTVKAVRILQSAEVVVYDRLVSDEVLHMAPKGAMMISVGKQPNHHPVPQTDINAMLVRLARAGKRVVRLKGGDPFIFGRGSEEAEALVDAGIPYDVVPGITAAQGCAANIRVPLTHRGIANSVRYITGHCREDGPLDLDWQGLANRQTTLVVYMGHATLARMAVKLIAHGRSADTPVLAINNGTLPSERRLITTLARVGADIPAAEFTGPVLFFVGEVGHLADRLSCGESIFTDPVVLPETAHA